MPQYVFLKKQRMCISEILFLAQIYIYISKPMVSKSNSTGCLVLLVDYSNSLFECVM